MNVQDVYHDSKGYLKVQISNREYTLLIPEGMTTPPEGWRDMIMEVEIKGTLMMSIVIKDKSKTKGW